MFVLSSLTVLHFHRKHSVQQTSSTSVAYTLLGGFVVAVGLSRALPVV